MATELKYGDRVVFVTYATYMDSPLPSNAGVPGAIAVVYELHSEDPKTIGIIIDQQAWAVDISCLDRMDPRLQ